MHKSARRAIVILTAVVGLSASLAFAADEKTLKEADSQLRDYVHYVKIARYDLAAGFGQAVVDKLAKPIGKTEGDDAITLSQFVKLVEDSGELARFDEATARGQRITEIESVSASLTNAYEQGKLEAARNPAEVTKSIDLLTGNQRQRLVARERLAYAGEYAMPQLLTALQRRDNPALQAEVRQLMVDMGRQSARPLQAALSGLEPNTQMMVAGILAEIPYATSLPYLADMAESAKTDAARESASRAIARLGNRGGSLSQQYAALGEAYYAGNESLTPFPRDSHQLVWTYDPRTGLTPVPVVTAVFHETMAMQAAEQALRADPHNGQALSLWLAADFSRELESPKDYVNPVYKDRPEAMFYAAAAGTDAVQAVLGRALDTKNVPLARRAIAALAKTAGPSSFANRGRNPLTEALRFPNRRIQTDAALVLASAAGSASFDGSERVVPILASAVREAGKKYALVLAGDNEKSKLISDELREWGYTVLPPALGIFDAEVSAAQVAGIDLVVTSLPVKSTGEFLANSRNHPRFGASPTLVFTDGEGLSDLGPRYDRDPMVRLIRTGVSKDQTAEAVKQLAMAATGEPMGQSEAGTYQMQALEALHTIGLGGSPVYNIADATGPLVAALAESKGALNHKIAEVLGRINDRKAQGALVDGAFAATGDDQLALLNAATESAKRFGNMLDDRQVKRLIDLAGKNTGGATGTALSALLGALNVQTDRVVPLILGTK